MKKMWLAIKKFLDKHFVLSFWRQMCASILLVALFSVFAPFCRTWLEPQVNQRHASEAITKYVHPESVATGKVENAIMLRAVAKDIPAEGKFEGLIWGARQIIAPGEVIGSIKSLDLYGERRGMELVAVWGLFLLSLTGWLLGIVCFSFITSAIVNFIGNRRRAIELGRTRYCFHEHGLVIGWDFQGAALVRSLLNEQGVPEVLIVSEQDASPIRAELKKSLSPGELSRVFIYNGSIADRTLLRAACPECCNVIAILGDAGRWDRDGSNLCAERVLHNRIKEKRVGQTEPIRLYLHLEDPLIFGQVRANRLPAEEDGIFDVSIFNFYESWAWRCWSEQNSDDGEPESRYLPIRHRPGTDRAELFVLGAGQMGQSFVGLALTLMNYGIDRRHCRVTVFDDRKGADDFLPKADVLAELPEVEVVFVPCSGGSAQADAIMLEAARREDTSVTVVIANREPVAAIRAYAALSSALRNCNISVLLRQSTPRANCPDKEYVQADGERAVIRYFGMTDVLPWFGGDRRSCGQAVEFYYGILDQLRPLSGRELAEKALSSWNGSAAENAWRKIERWQKWSSVNSGDSFKEKAFAFPDCASNPVSCTALLHAEHNRWWTERMLQGWRYAPVRDNANRQHPLMVRFDDLDKTIQSNDKINLAAMFQCGFLK